MLVDTIECCVFDCLLWVVVLWQWVVCFRLFVCVGLLVAVVVLGCFVYVMWLRVCLMICWVLLCAWLLLFCCLCFDVWFLLCWVGICLSYCCVFGVDCAVVWALDLVVYCLDLWFGFLIVYCFCWLIMFLFWLACLCWFEVRCLIICLFNVFFGGFVIVCFGFVWVCC